MYDQKVRNLYRLQGLCYFDKTHKKYTLIVVRFFMQANPETEKGVLDTLEAWLEAYGRRDVQKLVSLYLQEPDETIAPSVTILGSEKNERYIGFREVRERLLYDLRRFDRASLGLKWSLVQVPFTPGHDGQPNVVIPGMAWVASEVSGSMMIQGRTLPLSGRWTVILLKHDERWLITHSHFSFPNEQQDLAGHRDANVRGRFV